MPIMIPDIDPQTIENEGEREVYIALKEQLPDDWTVRYDQIFCRKRKGKITPDGQVDFIVVIPGQGLLFLEVKGKKNAEYTVDGGQCFLRQADGSLTPEKDPFKQAMDNKHDLVSMIQRDLNMGKYFQGRYGHAVVLPFIGDKGAFPVSHEPQVVWCFSSMDNLVQSSQQALALFGSDKAAQDFSAQVENSVCAWLRDKIELIPVKAAEAVEEERTITTLTRAQYDAVSGVLNNRRVRVEGVAGSGKTLIALWVAKALAEAGQKVLLLCFNKALAAWLQGQAKGSTSEIRHFHGFASEFCKRTGVIMMGDQNDASFWTDSVPIYLMDAVERSGEHSRYDCILVDEAQDFHANWWAVVEMLLKENGRLHIFLDPEQTGVYGQGQIYPFSGTVYQLQFNCRNTKRITSASGSVIQKTIASKHGVPDGTDPVFLKVEQDRQKRTNQLNTLVIQLMNDGYKPQDIAILSPWGGGNDKRAIPGRIKGVSVSDDVARWRDGLCFWGSTIKAFKGLEAKVIILTDIPDECPPSFTKTDLYVGVTRAVHRLYCIPMSASVKQALGCGG